MKCTSCNGTGQVEPPPAHLCECRVQLPGHHGEMDNCGEPAGWFYDGKWYCQKHSESEDSRVKARKKMITQELKELEAWEKSRNKHSDNLKRIKAR